MNDNNHFFKPEWCASWQTDDPDWVKQRKKDWKVILKSPGYVRCGLPSKEKKLLKNYFITGIGVDPEWLAAAPDYLKDTSRPPLMTQDSVLLELWLSANQSDDYTDWATARHPSYFSEGRSAFSRIMSLYMLTVKEELIAQKTMFAGADARLYKTFAPTHLYATKHYEAYSPEAIKKNGRHCINTYGNLIKHFLTKDYFSGNITPLVLDEWLPCIGQSIIFSKAFKDEREEAKNRFPLDYFDAMKNNFLLPCLNIIANPGDFDAVQIDVAKRIVEGFRVMTVNDEVDQHVKELLSTAAV